MEINPILSPMDIRFERNKGCKVSTTLQLDTETLPKEGVTTGPLEIDYPLEPPPDEYDSPENAEIEDDDMDEEIGRERTKPDSKTKLKSATPKSRRRIPKK